MLDTSYGFNNLLKEVVSVTFRGTNISPVFKKSSSRTSMPAKKSAPKSKGPSAPSVITTTFQRLTYFQLVFSESVEDQEAF